jgi:mono/diheme cytochrome c family protein
MVGGVAFAFAAALVGCRQPSVENGSLLFNHDCARCHAHPPGDASPAPNLAGYFSRSPQRTLREARGIIRDGRRAMPPFGQRLSSGEIDDVIAYIHTLRPPATIKPD